MDRPQPPERSDEGDKAEDSERQVIGHEAVAAPLLGRPDVSAERRPTAIEQGVVAGVEAGRVEVGGLLE